VAIDSLKWRIGVGILVWDSEGRVISTQSFIKELTIEPVVAKAMKALHGAEFCTQVGLRHIFLEGDALQVVNAMRSAGQSWNRFGQIVEDFRGVINLLSSWQIGYVKQHSNFAAHNLAKEAVRCIDH
jgi:hypothetical protein